MKFVSIDRKELKTKHSRPRALVCSTPSSLKMVADLRSQNSNKTAEEDHFEEEEEIEEEVQTSWELVMITSNTRVTYIAITINVMA